MPRGINWVYLLIYLLNPVKQEVVKRGKTWDGYSEKLQFTTRKQIKTGTFIFSAVPSRFSDKDRLRIG
jgi:hypothetical protein